MKRDMNRTGRNGAKSGLKMVGRTVRKSDSNTIKIYIGPSVEGTDKKYVKLLSGDVDRRKPSFA